MKKLVLAAATAAALSLGATAPAMAQELPKSPAKACKVLAQVEPELYAFIGTQPGACQSTLAAVGLEALGAGAFPSNAAAIGQCKILEETDFQAYTPEDGRAYPYQFYWFIRALLDDLIAAEVPGAQQAADHYDGIASQLYARNRADCVRVLRSVHPDGGIMGPVFGFLGSLEQGGEE